MSRFATITAASSIALPAAAQEEVEPLRVKLPSGLEAELLEVLSGPSASGLVYRFRFVAEGFTPSDETVELVQLDLQYLCDAYALGRLPELGPKPSQIIISLADRPTEFGMADSRARQVFAAFSPVGSACIWEMF